MDENLSTPPWRPASALEESINAGSGTLPDGTKIEDVDLEKPAEHFMTKQEAAEMKKIKEHHHKMEKEHQKKHAGGPGVVKTPDLPL